VAPASHCQYVLGAQGAAQNRAVDGDTVALRVLPPSQWHHMRGGALPSGELLAAPAPDPPLRSLRSPSHSGYCLLQGIRGIPVQSMTAAHGQAAEWSPSVSSLPCHKAYCQSTVVRNDALKFPGHTVLQATCGC
jgi:hypothetical protein